MSPVRVGLIITMLLASAGVAAAGHPGGPARADAIEPTDHARHQNTEAKRIELKRQIDQSIETLRQGLKAGTADAGALRDTLKKRAALYERAQLPEKAEADLSEAIAVMPRDAGVYADRAYFYMRHGRYADALGDFVAGTRYDAKNPVFSYGIGRVLATLKKYDDAVEAYTRSLQLDPTDARHYLSRAEALVWLGRYGDAHADYDQALTRGLKHEEKLFALVGRGYCSLELRHYEQAIVDLDAVLDRDPYYVNALIWRGYAREQRGQLRLALADYETAIKHDAANTWLRGRVRQLRNAEPQAAQLSPAPERGAALPGRE